MLFVSVRPNLFLVHSKRPWDAQREKVCVDIHVQAAGSQICLQNICGQQRNSPMADPIFGSKYGPQNGVQNWITFSFLLLIAFNGIESAIYRLRSVNVPSPLSVVVHA